MGTTSQPSQRICNIPVETVSMPRSRESSNVQNQSNVVVHEQDSAEPPLLSGGSTITIKTVPKLQSHFEQKFREQLQWESGSGSTSVQEAPGGSVAAKTQTIVVPEPLQKGCFAVCRACGGMSTDKKTCTRCRRTLPDDVKLYWPNSNEKDKFVKNNLKRTSEIQDGGRKVILVTQQANVETAGMKTKMFYRSKLDNMTTVLQGGELVFDAGERKTGVGRPRGRGRGGTGRGKGKLKEPGTTKVDLIY